MFLSDGDGACTYRPDDRKRKKIWKMKGIKYIESSNSENKYELNFQVHNMNDILFANFFQEKTLEMKI
jgi:hypothetical protein